MLTDAIATEFNKLKETTSARLVLKCIHGRYYVYKESGVWLKGMHRSKTISEYLGRIIDNGTFVKKSSSKPDLEVAKTIIAAHGGEIIWHKKDQHENYPSLAQDSNVDAVDLTILMSLSMNARMPVSRIADLAGISEQTAYSRIKTLERKFGINYILEINTEIIGFAAYLILVKFETNIPPVEDMVAAFKSEPKIQFAATTKGDYDIVAYMLDENSVKAENDLWKIMSETALSKYNAKWYMVPFGQTYSFVPLRKEFIEQVLQQKQLQRQNTAITPVRDTILKREFILLNELNNQAVMDFSVIDKKYNFGSGASRYTYQRLKENGIIIRPTIMMTRLPIKYIGILQTETINPKEVREDRYKLLIEEVEYAQITNKYALIGNTSIPEGLTLFMPITEESDLEHALLPLKLHGTKTKSMIILKMLVGSLCYRRFDNTYTNLYSSLVTQKKVKPQEKTFNYE